jgi:hypothetical protein
MLIINETSKLQTMIQQTIDHFTPILWCTRLFLQTHRDWTWWEESLCRKEYLTEDNMFDIDDIVSNIKDDLCEYDSRYDYFIDLAENVYNPRDYNKTLSFSYSYITHIECNLSHLIDVCENMLKYEAQYSYVYFDTFKSYIDDIKFFSDQLVLLNLCVEQIEKDYVTICKQYFTNIYDETLLNEQEKGDD